MDRTLNNVVHPTASLLIERDDFRQTDNVEEVDGRHAFCCGVIVPCCFEGRERLTQSMHHRHDRRKREDCNGVVGQFVVQA